MEELDYNQDGLVQFTEFDRYFLQHKLAEGVSKEHITRLYKYLDTDGDGGLSLLELTKMIDATNLTHDELMSNAFSPEFIGQLKKEILELFDKLDGNKNGVLSHDELTLVMKQQDSRFNVDQEQAMQIIEDITGDKSGQVNKK